MSVYICNHCGEMLDDDHYPAQEDPSCKTENLCECCYDADQERRENINGTLEAQ